MSGLRALATFLHNLADRADRIATWAATATVRRIAAAVLLTITAPLIRRIDNQIAAGVNDLDEREDA